MTVVQEKQSPADNRRWKPRKAAAVSARGERQIPPSALRISRGTCFDPFSFSSNHIGNGVRHAERLRQTRARGFPAFAPDRNSRYVCLASPVCLFQKPRSNAHTCTHGRAAVSRTEKPRRFARRGGLLNEGREIRRRGGVARRTWWSCGIWSLDEVNSILKEGITLYNGMLEPKRPCKQTYFGPREVTIECPRLVTIEFHPFSGIWWIILHHPLGYRKLAGNGRRRKTIRCNDIIYPNTSLNVFKFARESHSNTFKEICGQKR